MASALPRAYVAPGGHQDRYPSPGGPSPGGRCHVCSTRIVVAGDGDVVVKNAILRVDRASGRVTAKCPRCKAWVDVPLRYVG